MTGQPETPKTGVRIAKSEIQRRRKAMDADVWLFIKWVCGHGADDIARFHRPLAYMIAGDAVRLAAALNTYESEVVTRIREELTRRNIDWNTRAGLLRLRKLLQRVNDRISRSMGKTIIGRDVMLWKGSRDPNIDILIVSKSDDAAWAMCEAIGNIMRTEAYSRYYPDRLNPKEDWITKKWIRMAGRTVTEQDTIEARGINSQSYSKHYNEIYGDDLASTEAKQGDATVEDAIRFIASLHGISKSERFGGTRYVFNGTIQGPKDDHAALSSNPEYLSIVIPIWRHPSGAKWTIKNMMEDGVPVLPELYDIPACREKRADTLANDALGKISWLQNFLLCAHEAGAMQFTVNLLRTQFFSRIYTNQSKAGWLLRRYLYVRDDKGNSIPKRDPNLRKEGTCRCYRDCGLADHAYVQFDPLTLPRNLGVDQAISGTGDQWGVGVAAVDPFGHKYQFKGEYDRGYWKMVLAIPAVFNRYGGMANPPDRVAMESNTWQAISADWLKRDEALQYLARRIEKLPPTVAAKVKRIYNDIYAGLEDETLWLDPEDEVFQNCALKYNAADPDKQWDDPLDCVAMAIQTHKHAASSLDDAELKKFAQEQDRDFAANCDPGTWIDTSTNFLDYTAWN